MNTVWIDGKRKKIVVQSSGQRARWDDKELEREKHVGVIKKADSKAFGSDEFHVFQVSFDDDVSN